MEVLFPSSHESRNWNISLGLPPDLPAVFGRIHTCLPRPHFAQFLSYAIILFEPLKNADFFSSGIGHGDTFLVFDVDMFLS